MSQQQQEQQQEQEQGQVEDEIYTPINLLSEFDLAFL